MMVSDLERDGGDLEGACVPRRGDRSRWLLPDQPRHRLFGHPLPAPCVVVPGDAGSNTFEVGGAFVSITPVRPTRCKS
jgi:hypothetical protein